MDLLSSAVLEHANHLEGGRHDFCVAPEANWDYANSGAPEGPGEGLKSRVLGGYKKL